MKIVDQRKTKERTRYTQATVVPGRKYKLTSEPPNAENPWIYLAVRDQAFGRPNRLVRLDGHYILDLNDKAQFYDIEEEASKPKTVDIFSVPAGTWIEWGGKIGLTYGDRPGPGGVVVNGKSYYPDRDTQVTVLDTELTIK